ESGVGKRFADAPIFFGLYTFLLVIGAVVVLIPGLDLISVIVASQYVQGLLLPIVLVFMLLLVNNRALLGRHVNGRWLNVVAVVCVGLVVVLDVVLLGRSLLGAVGIQLG
ncbi:MAG: divalent metal cation transporter, partial [Candidatus Limnocylindrales bacterium]